MVEGGPHDESCRPVKSELQDQVDRLARALAKADVLTTTDNLGQRCTICGGVSRDFWGSHAEDCVKVWAVEHVAALEAGE